MFTQVSKRTWVSLATISSTVLAVLKSDWPAFNVCVVEVFQSILSIVCALKLYKSKPLERKHMDESNYKCKCASSKTCNLSHRVKLFLTKDISACCTVDVGSTQMRRVSLFKLCIGSASRANPCRIIGGIERSSWEGGAFQDLMQHILYSCIPHRLLTLWAFHLSVES